ncbi:MAG: 3-oxoacyl-ACP synthase III [Candidatus Aureabacteria bacterium]|nr:3-oxoacyl-ACP synthase III [Candidatus Auribacterota bacterium]
MIYQNVFLESFGTFLPERILSSREIETTLGPVYERLRMSPGRLELMSGVRERRLWKEGTPPSIPAVKAAEQALKESGIPRDKIGCLIYGAISRDFMEPATSSKIHHDLRLGPHTIVYDLSNACLGFINSILNIADEIELGRIHSGLVVAAECAESLYQGTFQLLLNDPMITRETIKPHFASLTTGSGAVACVLTHKSSHKKGCRLLGGTVQNASEHYSLCMGGDPSSSGLIMETQSETLLNKGCELAKQTWELFKNELHWNNDTPQRIFTHQVGKAHQQMLFKTLDLSLEKDVPTYETLGNMGSVSLPLTAAVSLRNHPPLAGEKMVLLGIGSGLNCCMLAIEG